MIWFVFAKWFKRYQPDVLYLSAGNPEPHANGNIVEHQLERLRQLWETVATDPEWQSVRVLPQFTRFYMTTNAVFKKENEMTRTDEMKDLTLWEIKRRLTLTITTQVFWNHLIIVMLTMITLSNSIVQSLHHFVRLLGNQILQRFIFLISQINFAWNQNHWNFTFSATVITVIFTKIVLIRLVKIWLTCFSTLSWSLGKITPRGGFINWPIF